MRRVLAFLILFSFALPAHAQRWGKSGVFRARTVTVGGVRRTFRVYVPRKKPKSGRPVVIAYHGAGGNGDGMARASGLDSLAKKKGFIAVYPDGIRRGWDIDNTRASNKDVAFTRAMLEQLGAKYSYDKRRVYAVGHSLGVTIVGILGKHLSTQLAAIANCSGGLGMLVVDGVSGTRKVPVYIVHGTADRVVPMPAARQQDQFYRQAGHTVEMWAIPGHGHGWASRKGVNAKLWTFFSKHSLPAPE